MNHCKTLEARIYRAALQQIVVVVESEGLRVVVQGAGWYDISQLVDEREHSPELLDLNRELIDLGLELGVIARHPDHSAHPHLVHINAAP